MTATSATLETLENRTLLSIVAVGAETQVNTLTVGDQQTNTAGSVAMDGDGNYVVTWSSINADGVNSDVYARRYNAVGVPLGTEFLVNTTSAQYNEQPAVEMDLAGNFVITWASRDAGRDIFARRYNAAGIAQGGDFRVNTTFEHDEGSPALSMDLHGNFVITWMSWGGQAGVNRGVFAQRYNAAGVAQGSELEVSTFIDVYSVQLNPSVEMDAAGNFVVAWHLHNNYDIYARRYNAAGVAQGNEFRVNTTTEGAQSQSAMAMDAVGNFVVIWDSGPIYGSPAQDGSGHGVYGQRYDAAGVAQGGEFRVNTATIGNQYESAVAMDEAGNFVVTWMSGDGHTDGSFGVYAQRYNAVGVVEGNEFRVNTTTARDQSHAAVAVDSLGDFVVIWSSSGQDGSGTGVYMQRYANSIDRMRKLAAPAFNGIGADIRIELTGVSAQASVKVSVAAARGLFSAPPVTFTNITGAANWSFSLDLENVAGVPPIVHYVTIDGPSSMTIVSVTPLHVAPGSVLGYTTNIPSAANSPSLSLGPFADIARVYEWQWDTAKFEDPTGDVTSQLLLGDDAFDWSKPTIFLTHGWNSTLFLENNEVSPITTFAQNFRLAHQIDYRQYNILAIDWDDDTSTLDSDPNNNKDEWVPSVAFREDAKVSAMNGGTAGRRLALKVDRAMKDWAARNTNLTVAPLTLIGHSNGAGLMASMAAKLSQLNNRTASNPLVQKLVALDPPTETSAWELVLEAAPYVRRIENYYIPFGFQREDRPLIDGFSINVGFGKPMPDVPMPDVSTVINFELSGAVTRDDVRSLETAHSKVFSRYSTTPQLSAQSNPWGFAAGSDDRFEAPESGLVWKEQDEPAPGHFVKDRPTSGSSASASTDESDRLARKKTDLVAAGVDLSNNYKGFNSLAQVAQSASQKVKLLLPLTAHSPTLASMDVPIPGDAHVLSFELSVLDSGNSDILLVGIDVDVMTSVDLDAVLQGGTATFTVPINKYAGTTRTLAFYMPSDESSDAQFVVSNVRFLTLNMPPIPELLTDKTVRVGQSLTFTAMATDSDGDSVQFFLDDTAPADARIDSQTGIFTWTPPANFPIGVYPVSIWVADDGPGNPATEVTVLITVNAIPIVTDPAATNSVQRPVISWTAIPGATEYDIWVTKNPSTNAYHLATVTGTSYTPPMDFGIGKFNLWVRAKNSTTVAPWTAKYTFVINTPVTPQTITRLQPTLRPTISWNALLGAAKYDVWINDVSRGITQHIRNMNVTGTSFTPSADLPLGLYRTWVRGIAADGTAGAWSTGIEFVTMQAPTVTQGLNSTFDRTPTFGWAELPGAAKYEVFIRNRNTGATTINQTNIAGLSFTPSTPIPDGPYRWWTIGVSAQGVRSFWTAPMDIYIGGRTDLLAPLGSTPDTTPTFAWRPVDGAIRYELWVTSVKLNARVVNQINLTMLNYTPTTALAKGNYRAWVRAVSTTGEVGIWSAQTDFVIAGTASGRDSSIANLLPDSILLTDIDRVLSRASDESIQDQPTRADASERYIVADQGRLTVDLVNADGTNAVENLNRRTQYRQDPYVALHQQASRSEPMLDAVMSQFNEFGLE